MPPYGQYYGQPQGNPYRPNIYNSPYAQQLASMEQQYPQYGQTMPPMQQGPMSQMPQQLQQGAGYIVVTSVDETRAYTPDLSGQPQIFYNKAQGQFYTKQFDVNTAQAVFEVYNRQQPQSAQNEPTGASDEQASSNQPDPLQPLFAYLGGIQDGIDEIKERLNREPTGNREHDGAAEPAVAANNPDGAGHAPAGSAAKPDSGKPNAKSKS